MRLHRAEFSASELMKVDTSKSVIFGSGGPLMDVEAVEHAPDGTVRMLCGWHDGVVRRQHLFDSRTLCMMRPLTDEDVSKMCSRGDLNTHEV